MKEAKFTITCNKCGSNDVWLAPSHHQTVIIECNKCEEMDEED